MTGPLAGQQVMHGVTHHPPDQQMGVVAAQDQRRDRRIRRHQAPAGRAPLETPQQQLAAMGHHHRGATPGRDAAVNHQQVAMADARGRHGIALDPQKERGAGMGHQLHIEIDRGVDIVGRRTGKACRHRLEGQRQQPHHTPRARLAQRHQISLAPHRHHPDWYRCSHAQVAGGDLAQPGRSS